MGRRKTKKRSWNEISKEIDPSIFVSTTQSSGRNQFTSDSKN
jgi:hypothetical protein